MEASASASDFIPAGLAALGIDADEIDLAVMGAVHQMLWGQLQELLALDTEGLEPERCPDLSRAPS
jgi:acetyl-CoA acetyltransferase